MNTKTGSGLDFGTTDEADGLNRNQQRGDGIQPLTPHEASPVVERLGVEESVPTILLSLEAYRDTHCIIAASGTDEIGWLGTVRLLGDERYLIERLFLFSQHVSGSHCEFDQTDVGTFWSDMLQADPANKAVLNSIRFWGHLHPGDMTSPSGQDEHQMELFAHNTYFIRGIFTRKGICKFDFFDYKRGVKIVDCPWSLYWGDEKRQQEIDEEVAEKVRGASFHSGYRKPKIGKGKKGSV